GYYFFGDRSLDGQYGKNVMETFLNIRNPYYLSYDEFSELSEIDTKEASKEFTDDKINEGYDGVYFNGNLNQEWVAYNPNQIKSATENVGTFSNESNDIRFQASSNNFSNFNENKTDDGLTYVSEKNANYIQTSLQFENQDATDDGVGSDNLQQEEI